VRAAARPRDAPLPTSSFASLSPRSVIARISLMTLILAAASYDSSLTSKAVFSSLGASASAAGAPAPACGGTPS
jgi:hypothetical protein